MGNKHIGPFGANTQAEANAENTRGPQDELPHGGGRRRRPPPCGEGRPKDAPHRVAR